MSSFELRMLRSISSQSDDREVKAQRYPQESNLAVVFLTIFTHSNCRAAISYSDRLAVESVRNQLRKHRHVTWIKC